MSQRSLGTTELPKCDVCNDALRLLADLFTEAEHETWRKEEIVNIIEDAIRLGSPQSSPHREGT